MFWKKPVGMALIVAGAVALYYGWQAKQTVGSRITEAFSGTPSDQAMWLLIGGAVAVVLGIVLVVRR